MCPPTADLGGPDVELSGLQAYPECTQNLTRSPCRREGLAGPRLLPDRCLEISFKFFFKKTETFLLILRFFHVRNFSLSKISSFISLDLLFKI